MVVGGDGPRVVGGDVRGGEVSGGEGVGGDVVADGVPLGVVVAGADRGGVPDGDVSLGLPAGSPAGSSKRIRSPLRTLPGNFVTAGKSPVSTSFVAAVMNRLKMLAGNEPPFTFLPWTFSIALDCPCGYPIHTAAVRR